jgi:hypothetical protein
MEKVFRKVKIENRLPEMWKWVTTIDSANEHSVYRLTDNDNWNMRDVDGINSPNNNLPMIYWLEEVAVDELEDYKMLYKSNLHIREMNKLLTSEE